MNVKYLFVVSVLLWAFLLACCTQEEEAPVVVDPSVVTIAAGGGEQLVRVTGLTGWTATAGEPWINVVEQSGASFKIRVGANPGAGERIGAVKVSSGSGQVLVAVNQGVLTPLQRDSVALAALYHACNGSGWLVKWNLEQPLVQWPGVGMKNGRVESLVLDGNGLSGALPDAFYWLTAMKLCDLHGNAISGTLAAGISELKALRYLDLSDNQLSGYFPVVTALTDLFMLDGSSNVFEGALPDLSLLTALEFVGFSRNQFSGTLPAAWAGLTRLGVLDLGQNALTGAVPAAWAAFENMKMLYLYDNGLEGAFPAFITDFERLVSLGLDDNNFTDTIPERLGDLPGLKNLWLSNNRFTGSLPASLYNHLYWDSWQPQVCPQQSGYGFDNCTSPAVAAYARPERAPYFQLLHESKRRIFNKIVTD